MGVKFLGEMSFFSFVERLNNFFETMLKVGFSFFILRWYKRTVPAEMKTQEGSLKKLPKTSVPALVNGTWDVTDTTDSSEFLPSLLS